MLGLVDRLVRSCDELSCHIQCNCSASLLLFENFEQSNVGADAHAQAGEPVPGWRPSECGYGLILEIGQLNGTAAVQRNAPNIRSTVRVCAHKTKRYAIRQPAHGHARLRNQSRLSVTFKRN